MEEQLTDPADCVLAIIDHLERSGEAEMAADIRALHIEASGCILLVHRDIYATR